ncbi:MAG: molecular chaperone HscB [bacterium]|jgi:molecular chaperone HscB
MRVDFSKTFFELFGFAEDFAIDRAELVGRFQQLQKQLHPDKFASQPDAEKRWSMQVASYVNEAYQTLGNDLRRAIYLLNVNGVSIDEETDTQMSPMFLMEQMEHREALEMAPSAADPFASLDVIRRQLKASTLGQIAAFESASSKKNWTEARTVVRQWQFLEKLRQEVMSTEESLDS